MDPIDDTVRAAMKALASQTPRDYFDELPSRIDRRLEGSMQSETDRTEENSGLHDIKALAHTQKQRIKRQTSQHDVDDPLRGTSSGSLTATSSGLHAVALPDPARMVSLPSAAEARELARSTTTAAVATEAPTTRPAAGKRSLVPWLVAGGGLAAAAAAIFAFTVLGKDEAAEPAAAPPAAVAAAPTAPPAPRADEGIVTRGTTVEPIAPAQPPPAVDQAAVVQPPAAEPPREESKKAEHQAARAQAVVPDAKDAKNANDASTTANAKKDKAKPDAKPAGGAAPKLDGAVIGDGDQDELGIGDVLKGGSGPKDSKPTKTELTGKEIRTGLDAINGTAKACYDKYNVAGTVKVKLTIDPSGSVSKASATGDFAGTPTGDCVAAAVKGASFPSWDGAPQSTTFVVLLSD